MLISELETASLLQLPVQLEATRLLLHV